MAERKKTVSLVLGSGGARGLAHIGVIKWLEEHGFQITSVSGSSIGALVGGIYASGSLDAFEQWASAITKMDMVALLDISWEKDGLIKGDRIVSTLVELIGDQLIEDLPFTFTAVAVDVNKEREVWIDSGKLSHAIRASISLPLFFTPFMHKGMKLIDGGILNPVPIAPTLGDGTELIIAVNLNGSIQYSEAPKEPSPIAQGDALLIRKKISGFIGRFPFPDTNKASRDWGAYDVISQSFDAMQSTIARQKLATYPPDCIIEIPRNACGFLEFDRASEIITLGYEAANEQLNPSI